MRIYQADKPEMHLFILWNNGYDHRNTLINDLKSRFTIKAIININWRNDSFNNNLKRFYGQKLPKNSNKMMECGNGPFTAIILEDSTPVYSLRMTTRGVCSVNINMFDIKERYRRIAGSNVIHGTNSEEETEHDITLLLGKSYNDLDFEKIHLSEIRSDIVGSKGWTSIQELLYVLNHTCKYVILRNFEEFPTNIQLGKHSDVDILCSDYISTKLILNGTETTRNSSRVQNIVKIGKSFVNVDLRYVGDDYLDKRWEEDILNNRVFHDKGFYSPNESDYLYSLSYHALVQKPIISEDYIERTKKICESVGMAPINLKDEDSALQMLTTFMRRNNYRFVEPKDYTVGYNFRKVHQKVGAYRSLLYFACAAKRKLKGK